MPYVNGISIDCDSNGNSNTYNVWASLSGNYDLKHELTVPFNIGSTTWTSMPNALNFFAASARYITYVDLTYYTGVNLSMNIGTAGTVSGGLFLRYLGTPSVTATSFLPLVSPEVYTRLETANTIKQSGFQPIVPGARSGVYIALMGQSGNASTSPVFGMINAIFK